jgi:hypothetical protein
MILASQIKIDSLVLEKRKERCVRKSKRKSIQEEEEFPSEDTLYKSGWFLLRWQ